MKKSIWVKMSAVLLLVGCATGVSTVDDQPRQVPREMPLELAPLFADNAVLQREMEVPVWGWATRGSQVTVTFAPRPGSGQAGQSKSATADEKGKWIVRLDPLEAPADERELTVTSSRGESIACEGVLVGEVWFASGQSNMAWGGRQVSVQYPKRANSGGSAPDSRIHHRYRLGHVSPEPSRLRCGLEEGRRQGRHGFLGHRALLQLVPLPGAEGIQTGANAALPQLISYEGLLGVPELEEDLKRIQVIYPGTEPFKKVHTEHLGNVKAVVAEMVERLARGEDAPASLPGIPAPDMKGCPTIVYNRIISPVRPLALSGIVFITSQPNITGDGERFAVEMAALARDLRSKYENEDLPFIYAQPTAELVPGITMPGIPNGTAVSLDGWPINRRNAPLSKKDAKTLAEIAARAAKAAR